MAKEKPVNYKFRDLKVFGSTEWLANNEKKYRLVYDESECTFMYCELSFFNKLFDEEDWEIRISLKCVNLQDKSEICNLVADRTIKKDENIVYIREGWGVKTPGMYWKKGHYRWEAWIDSVFVAEKVFYVEDEGVVSDTVNPYFNLNQIRLYEAPDSNIPKKERKYLSAFSTTETRYVWVELTCENLVRSQQNWQCELFFNFKTHSGQLKGSIEKLITVYANEQQFECAIGWGSDLKGTWGDDVYTVDIVFMDQLIASTSFEVGTQFVESQEPSLLFTQKQKPKLLTEKNQVEENEKIENVLHELDGLIGLGSIKKKVKEYTTYLNFIRIRKEKGFEDNDKINLHAVFTGNPGTGKTTVAKMLGKIYHELGLLSKGHVIEADRSDLVAEYIGQTAPKTKEAIKKARGGILFIDEAYALARKNDDSKDFGKEAIEILLKEMSDGDGDLAIIVAGYPDEMAGFLESNPGLKSRFSMYYDFPDYTPQELMRIADYTADKKSVVFSSSAVDVIYKRLVDSYRDRDKTFGNARFVNKLLDDAKMNMGLRIMKHEHPATLTKEELSTIEAEDVERIFETKDKSIADIPIDEELLRSALNTLHSMIGLGAIKQEIDELVKLVRFYKEIGKDIRQSFSLHAVFTGNPGTGKTTVARLLAQIYKALGILERGNLVECDRQALVGGYVGQTAIKTNEVINKAKGGVLFVDEAYALSEGGENDFGKEAVEAILKRMEDERGEFVVIVAGYTDNMKNFLASNPGLSSRFDRTLFFEDYNDEQLFEIALRMLANNSIVPDENAKAHLKAYMEFMYKTRNQYFGNARSVRKLVEETIKNQHLRLAKTDQDKRTREMISELTLADVQEFQIDYNAVAEKRTIGFQPRG
ncbi:MAG: AAA family ATPase [Bacteroidia bacterium]|jgi:SpoVK/Ycf46/Vps4 family AAA+-type ATPase|nr:AAA family ATPase [Bacteroidia bacterium]